MTATDMYYTAAIVCGEVAAGRLPILYAERSDPVDEADSGWQFVCGIMEEDRSTAHVWALGEVLELEPSLEPYIEYPEGTVLTRKTADDAWQVESDG